MRNKGRAGYTHVYTGDSKGKTTAALGLALRAAGAGMKIFICQFVKKRRCSEHTALERFSDLITIRQFGTGFIRQKTVEGNKKTDMAKRKAVAGKGLKEARAVIASGQYDMVILDEINIAAHYGLISVEDLLDLIKGKPSRTELVITGRYADKRVIEKADLVTEMKEIKHYFKKGIKARVGIEC